MDAAGELAQLGQRARQPLGELVDLRLGVLVLHARLEHPQLQRERDELLLRAVVQVALDPPARRVARLHDPQPRHPQLLAPAPAGPRAARSFSSASEEDAAAASTSSREVSSAASWMIAATRRPSRSTAVHARPEPGAGSSTGVPCSSTKRSRSGSQ